MATIHRLSLALAILAGAAACAHAAELGIGSKAPALDVEHWVQDGGGKFGKAAESATGLGRGRFGRGTLRPARVARLAELGCGTAAMSGSRDGRR